MITAQQVLTTPVPHGNDAGAETIGDYLVRLLEVLWYQKDGFSGKRPFGNSDWCGDVEIALIQAGHVEGVIDEYGYINSVDSEAVNRLIESAIQELRISWSGMYGAK